MPAVAVAVAAAGESGSHQVRDMELDTGSSTPEETPHRVPYGLTGTLRRMAHINYHDIYSLNATTVWVLVYCVCHFAIGVIFYTQVEQWTFTEALYFTVCTLSTVGYGDFSPSTEGSQIFTFFWLLFGLGLFTLLLGLQFRTVSRQSQLLETYDEIVSQMRPASAAERYLKKRRRNLILNGCLYAILLVFFLFIGTLFYSLRLDVSVAEGLYFSLVTGSSVGYGDIHPSRSRGNLDYGSMWFTIFYITFFVTFVLHFIGWISTEVFNAASRRNLTHSLPEKLTSRLIQSIDQNEDRRIDRTEFLMAVLVTNKIVDQLMVDMIMKRYEELDVDKDGFLTNDDVRAVTRAAVAGKAEEASRGSREAFIEVRENSSL